VEQFLLAKMMEIAPTLHRLTGRLLYKVFLAQIHVVHNLQLELAVLAMVLA
jgi:hypothetical protein